MAGGLFIFKLPGCSLETIEIASLNRLRRLRTLFLHNSPRTIMPYLAKLCKGYFAEIFLRRGEPYMAAYMPNMAM